MKKSKIALIFIFFLFQSPSERALAQDISATENAPTVLATFEYPPLMEKKVEVDRPGFAIEIIREVFKRMKTPLKIDFYPFGRAVAVLDKGLADGIFTIKKTPEREFKYIFSNQPLIKQDYVIFANKDTNFSYHGDLKELTNKSIGVVSKTSYGPIFDGAVANGQFKKIEVAFSLESNFRKLLAHRMDIVICSRIVGIEILKKLDIADKVAITGPPVDTVNSYLMLRKNNQNYLLMNEFDKALSDISSDGTFGKIEKKYFN